MLFLLFHLDSECYALDAGDVVEILPLLSVRGMLRSPPGVVGTINYHGAFVPVVDVSELGLGRRAAPRLSTRIIIVRRSQAQASTPLLGLIAEQATATMRLAPADFVSPGMRNAATPYLGGIATGPQGPVQRIELSGLLPAAVAEEAAPSPVAGP